MVASLETSSQSFRVISRNFKGSLPTVYNSIPRKNEICPKAKMKCITRDKTWPPESGVEHLGKG